MGKTNTNWNAVNLFKDRAQKIDCKEHFRLKKYEVTVKEVAKVRYGTHCKYNINYHLVWIPKTRMKILVDPFKTDIDTWINEICRGKYWNLLALEIMPDHIHCFVSAHPKWAPTKVVQILKQETSKKLRSKYSCIRDTRTTPDFWATGYYVGTAGHVSAHQVARYILEQTKDLKKNWNLFDVKPFEYDINEVKRVKDFISQKTLLAFGGEFNSTLHSV
jgi:putative transposase